MNKQDLNFIISYFYIGHFFFFFLFLKTKGNVFQNIVKRQVYLRKFDALVVQVYLFLVFFFIEV
jgi:hypothetical protein